MAPGELAVDKQDIKDLHAKLDNSNACLNQMKIAIEKINSTIANRPRPCPQLVHLEDKMKEHEDDANLTKITIKRSLIRTLFHLGELGLVALIVFWWTYKKAKG